MTPDDQAFSLGEALARMAEQEYAAERRDIAYIYAWYAVQILEGFACRCRWPRRYCPHDGPSLIYWLAGRHDARLGAVRVEALEYLKTYPE